MLDPARIVVLGGGGSRRLGHDKLAARLGAATVLDVLLSSLAASHPGAPLMVVGAERPTGTPVTWRREHPPGGGPVAGVAVAVADLDPGAVVAVVAGDQPFAAPALAVLLTALGDRPDGAIGVDPSGHDQPLLAVYRVGALQRGIGVESAGRSVRSVLSTLTVVRVPLQAKWCLDVDTAADLATVRAHL